MDDTRKVQQLLSDLPAGLEIKIQPGLQRPYEIKGDVLLVQPAAWEEWKRNGREKERRDG